MKKHYTKNLRVVVENFFQIMQNAYVVDLRTLLKRGYYIKGVTSDWHGSIVVTVKYALPDISHQRCLVHTQRRCEALLSQRPKTQAGKDLLQIIKFLNHLKSYYEVRNWLKWFHLWETRYEYLVRERTYATKDDGKRTWWHTHKNLRAAYRTIFTTRDYLFLYLDYSGLDKDINNLEAEFSHLKQKVRSHRGLKRKKKIALINWYIYFLIEKREKKNQ